MDRDLSTPVVAGIVAGLVGFTSAFVVVLTGLRGAGASETQAASGLLAVTLLMGVASIVLSWRSRMPITVAWSTPGAALLASATAVAGGWPAAVGAFAVVGALFVVTGLWPQLADLIRRIPAPVAQAMLAGVVLHLVVDPLPALVDDPGSILPIVGVWLLGLRWWPRWAVPGAFVVAAAVIGIDLVRNGTAITGSDLLPAFDLTRPSFGLEAMIGIAIPLYLVTMASQNIPGVAVLDSFGYQVPWRPAMLVTGVGTIVGAPAGGHAINLAAISAALAAGPEAGRHERRWIAGVSAGATHVVLAAGAAAAAALIVDAPDGVVAVVAAVALLPTLGAALGGATRDPAHQIPAMITFAVAASGIAPWNVSAAFWALLAGIAAHLLLPRPARGG